MKITIVCDVLGEPNNGTSIASYNLINHLKSKGHEVKVVCPNVSKKGEEGYYILPTINFGIFNNYVRKNGVELASKDMDILKKAIDGADVVHVMLPFFVGHATAKYCHENHIPLTTGFHAQAENIMSHFFLMHVEVANALTYKAVWKLLHQYADAIHYPTQFICDYVKKYGIKAPKEYVISNGVNSMFKVKNVERPEELKDKFVIIMSGRYSKEKNQKILLKAVKESKYEKDIQVILAGGGPRAKKLREYGNKYLTNKPILSLFKREDLVDVINSCDLYVHTSSIEIEAISCLEAISCGLVPCISDSPKSATSKFALTKESHFKNGDYKDLSKKIDWWIEHPEYRKEMGPKYAEFARQFDFESCMNRMEEMFIEVINNYGKKEI